MSDVARVASWLRGARAVVVITGAGISAESGVPTFRGADGLWRSFRPEDLATPQAFARDPELVWNWDSRFPDYLLLTQNVEGLHTRAGSRRLVEVHGNIWRARCTKNPSHVLDESGKGVGSLFAERYAEKTPDPFSAIPRCSLCGAMLRPDVVWFGEALDGRAVDRALTAIHACDVLLLVGTSGVVYPVAGLPSIVRRQGARVVEINLEPTPLSEVADVVLRGPSGTVLPAIEAAL